VQARPPRFRFFVNDPGLITRDYGYWVENQLRERFELEGVPCRSTSSGVVDRRGRSSPPRPEGPDGEPARARPRGARPARVHQRRPRFRLGGAHGGRAPGAARAHAP
jgi:hypothetical protein